MSFFEANNCYFNIIDENNSFSFTTLGYCSSRGSAETMNRLHKFLELRSQNYIDLHVEVVRKRGNQIKIGDKENKLSDLDTPKNETNKNLEFAEYNDLEAKVLRLQ